MTDVFIDKIHKYFSKDKRIVFFTTFIIGMLVHFALYSNQLVAYDGYWHYGAFLAKGWEISLGRFIIPLVDLLRGTVVSSVLTSTISILIVSFTTLILTDLLNIKKTYIKVLIGILLVVTPTFSFTLMYTYTADSYTLALLFSVLSVHFLNKKRNVKNVILSLICIIVTCGLYQAYLSVIVTLSVVLYLIDLCTKNDLSFKKFIKKVLADIGIILLGTIIYYIALTIIVKILHLNINEYNGGNAILSLETLKNLLPSIKHTYATFFEFHFTNNFIASTKTFFRHVFNAIMLALVFINFILIIKENKTYKKPWQIIFVLLLLAMFPVFTCITELIVQDARVYLLMLTALYFLIIILLKQIELIKFDKLNLVSIIIVLVSIWTFVITDNATYVASDMYSKQMYAYGNRIIYRLEENEEITENTPICIIGKMKFSIRNPLLLKLTYFDVTDVSTWSWQIFLQDKVALGREIYTNEIYDDIYNSQEFKNMGIFPNENSIKIINGIAVVKIGD